MKIRLRALIIALVLLSNFALEISTAFAQGTAFTYQGQLSASGSPASGNYDFTFALFNNSSTNTGQIGGALTNLGVSVSNGLFVVTLNFGSVFTGTNYWLAIGVRTNGASSFTALSPLQELTPAPYAIMANAASNLLGNIQASQLPATVVTNNATSLTLSGTFAGSGASLANLNANNLASGTIPAARLPLASSSAPGIVQGDGNTISINGSGVESVVGSALTGVNAALATNLAAGAAITNLYPVKWVGGNYTVTTNDRVIFSSASTNTTNTLPAAPPAGIMFTFFNKGTGLVTITNSSGIITIPGIGTNSFATLGIWSSTSSTLTVTFDGTNY